jgi:peroxiredoxin
MKLRLFVSLSVLIGLTSFDLTCQITLPVKLKDGFGQFPPKLVAYSGARNKNDISDGTLALKGILKSFTEVKIGYMGITVDRTLNRQNKDTNRPLSEHFEKDHDNPESLGQLAFVYGKNPEGKYILKFDKNLDGNFADEEEYSIGQLKEDSNIEDLTKDTVKLSLHYFQTDETAKRFIPFIFKVNEDGNLFYSIAMYGMANIYNVDIAVNFQLSTDNQDLITQPLIGVKDSMENGLFVEAGHLFRIKNNIFKYKGMNLLKESLYLERVPLRRALTRYTTPSFSAKELTTGETISLQDFQGKFLYIDFWGSWCKPCIAEMPNLRNAIAELKHENIEFLGVAEDNKKAAQAAIHKFNITWPQVLSGRKNSITDAFNITSFPTTLLLAPDGQIIAENLRGESLTEQLLEEIQRYKLLLEMKQ